MTRLVIFFLIAQSALLGLLHKGYAADYVVGPGDVLRITVFEQENMSTTGRITENGVILLPLLGPVNINGLTIPEVSEKLSTLLADGYLVNPMVNVFVEEFRSQSAVVLGHINSPGLLELSGPTTLLQLISKAGGLKDGSGNTATIKRDIDGIQKVIVIDLVSLLEGGDLSNNISVMDGDTVFVSRGGQCYVTGQVKSPGAYLCKDQPTVLKLIAIAGGFTGKAAKSSVDIVRVVEGKKTIIKDVDLQTSLSPDDVIVVPEGFW